MAFRTKTCLCDTNEGYGYTLCMLKPACRVELSHQTCTGQRFSLQPSSAYLCAPGTESTQEHIATLVPGLSQLGIACQAFHSLANVCMARFSRPLGWHRALTVCG